MTFDGLDYLISFFRFISVQTRMVISPLAEVFESLQGSAHARGDGFRVFSGVLPVVGGVFTVCCFVVGGSYYSR